MYACMYVCMYVSPPNLSGLHLAPYRQHDSGSVDGMLRVNVPSVPIIHTYIHSYILHTYTLGLVGIVDIVGVQLRENVSIY